MSKDLITSDVHPLMLENSSLNKYIKAATSENTRRAYRQDIQHFIAWGGLLPTSADIILQYLHAHANQLNPRTLSRRLTAIKHWHVYQGFADPTSNALVKKTLMGIQNVHGRPKNKAPALTTAQLIQMVTQLENENTLQSLRNIALLQIGFFGAFRRSELSNMQWENIRFVEQGIEILIPRSKGDQIGEGQICALPYGVKPLCPVIALENWREKSGIKSGYIFRAINRYDHIHTLPLTPNGINLIIKTIAMKCELPYAEKISAHSLRRGFATETSRNGAPFAAILRHGRWKHEKTVLGYIEEGQRFNDNAVNHLFKLK